LCLFTFVKLANFKKYNTIVNLLKQIFKFRYTETDQRKLALQNKIIEIMKSLLALPPLFLGSALTTYYYMLNSINLNKSLALMLFTLLFFIICILFIVSHRESKHYIDTFFLSLMLSGVTIPICYLFYSAFISKSILLVVGGSAIFHLLMLFAGLKIVKKWYNYSVPYFEK